MKKLKKKEREAEIQKLKEDIGHYKGLARSSSYYAVRLEEAEKKLQELKKSLA